MATNFDYKQFSSITSADGRHQLYICTSTGACWLETDGVLVKEDCVDSTQDLLIQKLAYDFEYGN